MSMPSIRETSNASGIFPRPEDHELTAKNITQEHLDRLFAHHFTKLIAPFWERVQLMEQGNYLKAVSLKPSGIWYGESYARALHTLGDTEIPINGKRISASILHNCMKRNRKFSSFSGVKKYWESKLITTNSDPKFFSILVMKDGVLPHEAYQSFSTKLTFLDCQFILNIACAETLIDLFGNDNFDKIHKDIEGQLNKTIILRDAAIDYENIDFQNKEEEKLLTNSISLIEIFRRSFQIKQSLSFVSSLENLCPGENYYIYNHPDYTNKHPHSSAVGYNIIYLGNGKFTAFGLPPQGLTLKEIAERLHKSYNNDPIREDLILSEEDLDDHSFHYKYTGKTSSGEDIQYSFSCHHAQQSFKNFQKKYPQFHQRLLKKIQALIRTKYKKSKNHTLNRKTFYQETSFFRDEAYTCMNLCQVLNIMGFPTDSFN